MGAIVSCECFGSPHWSPAKAKATLFRHTLGGQWGPVVAGWLSAFPIVSGPILLNRDSCEITIEHGRSAVADACGGDACVVCHLDRRAAWGTLERLSGHVSCDEHRAGRLLASLFRSGICSRVAARHGIWLLRVCYVLPGRFRVASRSTCYCGILTGPAMRAARAAAVRRFFTSGTKIAAARG